MTVGVYLPNQRIHIQFSIISEVSVVDIDFSPVMVGIRKKDHFPPKKITFYTVKGKSKKTGKTLVRIVAGLSVVDRFPCQGMI